MMTTQKKIRIDVDDLRRRAEDQYQKSPTKNHEVLEAYTPVNANAILHNSGEEKMHESGEKSLWVSFK